MYITCIVELMYANIITRCIMKKTIFLILKIILIVLTLIFTFTNVTAGIAFLSTDKTEMGIKLIILTVIGYDIATILVMFKKEIIAFVLSAVGSLMLLAIRTDFLQFRDTSTAITLYETRNLPAISITAVILIFAIIKSVKLIKSVRRKRAQKNREKAPSIFN